MTDQVPGDGQRRAEAHEAAMPRHAWVACPDCDLLHHLGPIEEGTTTSRASAEPCTLSLPN